ncbi:MAG: shikimate dehydrogenase [Deltaproteobacteria bacterium]|jgi:shikimate dehydrogenase|nr:shikimate dehydrogenase [Deltaproteobacteria bacterium]
MNNPDSQEFWLLGLLGGPMVALSPSPRMHKSALNWLDLLGHYVALEVKPEDLGGTLAELFHAGYQGLNVTNPHKITIRPHLCGVSPEAGRIGSVNTLVLTDDGYYGDNTDARGFAAAYLGDLPGGRAPRALVLGAGGAARAVTAALLDRDVRPLSCSRDRERARELAGLFGLDSLPWSELSRTGPLDLVVNATSSSGPGEFEPAPPVLALARGAMVIDVNYGRSPNFFRELAERNSAAFHDGQAMLAHQARLSFATWTSLDPGLEPFVAALDGSLGKKKDDLRARLARNSACPRTRDGDYRRNVMSPFSTKTFLPCTGPMIFSGTALLED